MNEPDLREALTRATDDVPAPDLASVAWTRGRRRRRQFAMGTVAGAIAVTAAVVVGVVLVVPDAPSPVVVATPTPTPSELTPPDPQLGSLYDRVLEMQRVNHRDSAPTYVLDGRLWYGTVIQVTHGVRGTVTAEDVATVGWMAQLRRPNELVAGWFGPMGGDFEPFPYQDTSNPKVFAADPGGGYIAMGASLLDQDGELVGDLPDNVADTQAWTPVGLVYSDAAGGAWLWRPRFAPLELASSYDVNPEGWGIEQRDGCSTVVRLLGSGIVERVFKHCGEYPIVTLSPGWTAGPRLALTASGEVFDTASGELVQQLDLPEGLVEMSDKISLEYGGWWRGNVPNELAPKAFVSFTIDLGRATNADSPDRYRAFILGCKVTTGECGRFLTRYADSASVPFVWR
jgi:hypothetical protein